MKKQIKIFLIAFLSVLCMFNLAACGMINDSDKDWGEWVVTVAATCEIDGVETRASKTNSAITETRSIAALGHDWDIWGITTEPTCLVAGVETRVCKDCGNNDVRPVIALGHAWGEWVVTIKPTCTAHGIETRICEHDANHTDIRSASVLGHDWSEWVITTAPTCTTQGIETRICRNENAHFETRSVAELGHDWSDWVYTTTPTETVNGAEMHVCRNDKTHVETRIAYAIGTEGLIFALINDGTSYSVRMDFNLRNTFAGEVVIPQYYNGLPVTRILTFSGFRGITNVVIPEGIIEILTGAFNGCTGFKNLKLPKSVINVNSAFSNCVFDTITVEPGNPVYKSDQNCLIEIRSDAWLEGIVLLKGSQNATIPDYITYIWNNAFYGCDKITSIEIPNTVTNIGSDAFSYTSLTSVHIPRSVTRMEAGAFSYCTKLTNLTVDTDNESYMSEGNCIIWKMNSTLMTGCKTSIIPSHVKIIGSRSFQGSEITSISIPNGVTEISMNAFDNCRNLKSVNLPNSLINIQSTAFSNCHLLESVVLPNSVKTIGGSAFRNCSSLKTLSIGNSVETIGTSAFENCLALESIVIPDSVKNIGNYAFWLCDSIKTLHIGKGVTGIGGSLAFGYSVSLESITVDEANSAFKSEGNCLIRKADNALLKGCKTSIIPEYVTSIEEAAFEGTIGLKHIVVPQNVTAIKWGAFTDCLDLESVVLPNSLISMGPYVFFRCPELSSVFYYGDNWDNIAMFDGRAVFTSSPKIYYYSETAPTTPDTHWRYIDGVPTIWE